MTVKLKGPYRVYMFDGMGRVVEMSDHPRLDEAHNEFTKLSNEAAKHKRTHDRFEIHYVFGDILPDTYRPVSDDDEATSLVDSR